MVCWFSDGNFWWLLFVLLFMLVVVVVLWCSVMYLCCDLLLFLLMLGLFVLGFIGLVLGMWLYLLLFSMILW